jgi:hypothetical protein
MLGCSAVRIAVALLVSVPAAAQDVRQHTRPPSGTTNVTTSQAEALTLTVSSAVSRLVQTWVRIAGTVDQTEKILSGDVSGPDAALITVGQRVRAFPPSAKSSMYQAFVTRVTPRRTGAKVEATLRSAGRADVKRYVMEILIEQGPFLSVPNEAIIEEAEKRILYVQQQEGQYAPREVHLGIQGELYTQVLGGVNEGDQVVTFGSFFIDAEHKLKGSEQSSAVQSAR